MKLEIKKSKSIQQLKQEFQSFFSNLKIEFYQSSHQKGEGSEKDDLLSESISLENASSELKEGTLSILVATTAAELEQSFARDFGLNVQVFRKSGEVWLQTIAVDSMTLVELNEKGKDKESQLPEDPIVNAMDRQELE